MQVPTKLALLALSLVLLSGGVAVAEGPQENPTGVSKEVAVGKVMAPGEMHKHLAKMAGDWTFTNRMWMAPGQPPLEWSGTMHAETILGGRYVQSIWMGSFMGQEFEGRGTEGYDHVAQQYASSWVDSLGSGIVLATGTCEDGGRKCTTTRSSSDPVTGGPSTMKTVVSWIDDDNFKREMYAKDPASGQEYKAMEIVAKRK